MKKPKRSPGGVAIAAYLEATGWSQQQLAEACDLTPPAIAYFVSGKRPVTAVAAIHLVKGTAAAEAAGLVSVEPLTFESLVPNLATHVEVRAVFPARTGTTGCS